MFSRAIRSGTLAGLGVLLLATAAAAASADIQAWNWLDGAADNTADAATAGPADRTPDGDIRLADYARFTANQAFYGDATANANASIGIRPVGADRPGAAGAAMAIGNYLSFESDQTTSFAARQRHEAAPSDAPSGRVSVAASAAIAVTGNDGEPIAATDAVNLNVAAISNFLSVNLASQDREVEYSVVIDQQSDADVLATVDGPNGTGGEVTRAGALPTGTASNGNGANPSQGTSTTAITNFTSLRFDSSSTSQSR